MKRVNNRDDEKNVYAKHPALLRGRCTSSLVTNNSADKRFLGRTMRLATQPFSRSFRRISFFCVRGKCSRVVWSHIYALPSHVHSRIYPDASVYPIISPGRIFTRLACWLLRTVKLTACRSLNKTLTFCVRKKIYRNRIEIVSPRWRLMIMIMILILFS